MKTSPYFYAAIFVALTSSIVALDQDQQMNYINSTAMQIKGLTGRFLHITDIHVDPNYLVGSDPDKLCHRKSKKSSKNTAGKFGSLNTDCDSPLSLVHASFQFMKSSLQDIDFIIYTGDTARHDRDDKLQRTGEDVWEDHKAVINFFRKAYDVSNIKLIPTIGNNDMPEHNTVIGNDGIFKSLETIWKPLGLNLGDSFKTGGYFVQDDVVPGLRVINTNSMFFFRKNKKAKDCNKDSSTGAKQLIWIEQQLKQAKKDNVMVYLMGHVPPNDDDDSALFLPSCLHQYYELLGQYGDHIAGHFTGHTNNDMLTAVVPKGKSFGHVAALPDNKNLKSTSVAGVSTVLFNAPSIIPVNNPAVRVYEYETNPGSQQPVGTILDWTQYYVDLDKANKDGQVKYELEYKASDLYGVNRFDAQGVSRAFRQLRVNGKARNLYSKYVTVSRK